MATLLVLLMIAATAYFIYEGIVAPALRDDLKNQMFELRDQLRVVRMRLGKECPGEAFEIAHNGINQYINRLHWVTVSFVIEFNRAHRKPALRQQVLKRRETVANCGIPELAEITNKGNKVVETALVVNSGALLALAIPAVMAASLTRLPKRLYAKASEMFASPEKNTEQLLARSHCAM